jgi:hypothetical protein
MSGGYKLHMEELEQSISYLFEKEETNGTI